MLLIVYDPVLISVFGYLANYYLLVKSNTLFSCFSGCFVIEFFLATISFDICNMIAVEIDFFLILV